MSGPHPRREYELTIRQEPKQARMCGVGGKADRRPIDPPPIIQLRVLDPPVDPNDPHNGHDPTAFLQNPYYFMFACLAKPEDDTELHWLKDGRTKCTTGSVVSSLYHLRDAESADNADVGFFVFPDLSVRTEGSYRLKLSLYEIVGNSVRHCKSIFSAPFYVFTAKKFPGMEESTPLSCSLADQGIKIRIRKDIRSRKRPQPQNVQLMSVGAGDGGGSSLDQPFAVEAEPGSPRSSTSSPDIGARSGKRRRTHLPEESQPEPEHTTLAPIPQSRWGSVSVESGEGAPPMIPPPPGASRSETPPGPQLQPSGPPQLQAQASGSNSSINPPTPSTGAPASYARSNPWYTPPPPPPPVPAPAPPTPVAQTPYDPASQPPSQPPPGPPQSYYYQAPPHPPPPQYAYPYPPYAPNGAPPQHPSWGYDHYYNPHHHMPHAAPHHPHPHAPPPMPPYGHGYHPQAYPPPYYDPHAPPHPHYHPSHQHPPHPYSYEYGPPQPPMSGPPASPPPSAAKDQEPQPPSRGPDPSAPAHSAPAAPPYTSHPGAPRGSYGYHPPPAPQMPAAGPPHWYGQHPTHPQAPPQGHTHPQAAAPPPHAHTHAPAPPPPPPPTSSAPAPAYSGHPGHAPYPPPPPASSGVWDAPPSGSQPSTDPTNYPPPPRSRSSPPPLPYSYSYHPINKGDGPIHLAPLLSRSEPTTHDGGNSSSMSGFGQSGTRLPAPPFNSVGHRGGSGSYGGPNSGDGRAKLDIRNIVDDRRDDDES